MPSPGLILPLTIALPGFVGSVAPAKCLIAGGIIEQAALKRKNRALPQSGK